LSSKAAGTAPAETAAEGTVMGLGVGMGKPRCYRKRLAAIACRMEQKNREQTALLLFFSSSLFLYLKNSSSR
jgi:hypothetical protein